MNPTIGIWQYFPLPMVSRHLALMEWAAALKLFNYACIGFALFLPWGIAVARTPASLAVSIAALTVKFHFPSAARLHCSATFAKKR